MSIDTFLNIWNDNTTEIADQPRLRLYKDVLVIQVSKSGRPNTVRLNELKSKAPRKGHSSRFLKWLTAEADKGKFTLTACVQPCGYSFESSPSKEDLKNWFIRNGFTVKWEYLEKIGYEMERKPQ